jgi:hypothetical protein
MAASPALPKRGPGRPPLPPENRVHGSKSKLTLDGPIPTWIGYEDVKALIRAYRTRMYDERTFSLWVEQGVVPSYIEKGLKTAVPGVRRRKYRWEEVRAWIDSQMEPVPAKGILVNGVFQPIQARP